MARNFAAILFVLFASPVLALDFTPDDLRTLIKARDFVTVEKKLDEVQFAAQTGNFAYDDQRKLYEVFQTTDPEVEKFIEDWGDIDTLTVHLPAAKFSNLYHYLWIARGEKNLRQTYPRAMERMYDHVAQATPLARYMFEKFPDFVPGSDAVLRMHLFGGRDSELVPLLEKIFEHTPTRESLDKARWTVQPNWGGSIEQMFELCEKFAARVEDSPGYTIDKCKIEAIYIAKEPSKEMTWAQMMLDRMPEDQMPEQRLIDATRFRPDPKLAIALLTKIEEPDPEAAKIIEYDFGATGVYADEKAQENAANLEKLKFDPRNPTILYSLARYIILFGPDDDGNAQRAQVVWQYLKRAVVLGDLRSEIFMQLEYVHPEANKMAGIFDSIISNERAVVLSNYGFAELAQYFDHIYLWNFNFGLATGRGPSHSDEPGVDYPARREQLACPLVRSASLIEYMCVNNLANSGQCSVEGDPYGAVTEILTKARETNTCPQFLNKPVEDLLFEEY